MRISKRQLRKIIKESLSLQNEERRKGITKPLNFRRIRIDLDKFKKDLCNEELYDIIRQHEEDLKYKVEGSESKLMKGRFREAESLLEVLTNWLKKADDQCNQTPDTGTVNQKVIKQKEPPEDRDKWKPDPKPGSEWEYQLRNCFWYARKKGTMGKGVKLGPAKATSGKYLASIKILDNEYANEISSCDTPIRILPKPTPPEITTDPPKAQPVVKKPTPQDEGGNLVFDIIDILRRCTASYDKLALTVGKTKQISGGGSAISSVFGNNSKYIDTFAATTNKVDTFAATTNKVMTDFQNYQIMDPAKAFTAVLKDYNIKADLQKVYQRLVGDKDPQGATRAGIIRQCLNMSTDRRGGQEYVALEREFSQLQTEIEIKLDELIKFVKDNKGKQPGKFTVNENRSRASLYRNRRRRY